MELGLYAELAILATQMEVMFPTLEFITGSDLVCADADGVSKCPPK